MQVQGYVQEIAEKQTRIGKMYDIKVNGDYYGVGKYPPRDVSANDYVEFVAEQNGNFRNVGRGTLRKIDAPAGASKAAAPAKQQVGMSYDDKQAVISKQAALNTSIAFVSMAVNAGALPASDYDSLEAAVIEQASRFHEFSTGHPAEHELEFGTAPKPKTRRKPKAKPAPEPEDMEDDGEWED